MREAKDDPATFLRGEIELVDDDQHGDTHQEEHNGYDGPEGPARTLRAARAARSAVRRGLGRRRRQRLHLQRPYLS